MDSITKINKEVTNNNDYLIDTNVLIYAANEQLGTYKLPEFTLAISNITRIELLGKKNIAQNELQDIQQKLQQVNIINLDRHIENVAIQLKQQTTIKLPDAVIAATAIWNDMTLVTADVKLAKVDGLKVLLVQPESIDTQVAGEIC